MMLWHGDKALELEGFEEELLVGIPGYNGQHLDKTLDDHILCWCLRGWNLCV